MIGKKRDKDSINNAAPMMDPNHIALQGLKGRQMLCPDQQSMPYYVMMRGPISFDFPPISCDKTPVGAWASEVVFRLTVKFRLP